MVNKMDGNKNKNKNSKGTRETEVEFLYVLMVPLASFIFGDVNMPNQHIPIDLLVLNYFRLEFSAYKQTNSTKRSII